MPKQTSKRTRSKGGAKRREPTDSLPQWPDPDWPDSPMPPLEWHDQHCHQVVGIRGFKTFVTPTGRWIDGVNREARTSRTTRYDETTEQHIQALRMNTDQIARETVPFGLVQYGVRRDELFPLDELVAAFWPYVAENDVYSEGEIEKGARVQPFVVERGGDFYAKPMQFALWVQGTYRANPGLRNFCTSCKGDSMATGVQSHVYTELERRIVEELSKEPMTAPELCERLAAIGFERDLDTVKKALRRLKKRGIVANRRGVGYYLVERPPEPSLYPLHKSPVN